jgi:adenylosuccinate lyase
LSKLAAIVKRLMRRLEYASFPNFIHSACLLYHQVLSHQAGRVVKEEGGENDLIDRVKADPYFKPILGELDALLDPKTFIGRCPQQVDRFIKEWVEPALAAHKEAILNAKVAELSV